MRQVKSLEQVVAAGPSAASEEAGFGLLSTERGGLPLVAMDVRAAIAGFTSEVRVRQTYRNSLSEALEATHIFPMPSRAAVTAFRMEVAGRVVEGDLKERAAAREEYEKAMEAGHRAAIAEEERSGTFSLRVGNIPAKELVTIELTLVGPVAVANGEATFRFPLVVAPRYVPGIPLDGPPVGAGWGADTDQVPDASRVTPPVLLPGFPNPVRLSLEVAIDPAGLGSEDGNWSGQIRTSLHSVIVEEGPPWTVRLQPGEQLNRDFILRFPVAGAALQATLLTSPHATGQPSTFALTLVPPASDDLVAVPRDVVVVLDRSGSMQGWKIVAARRAVGRMIDTLLDQDRFALLAFDNGIEYPPHANKQLVAANDQNRWRALEWLGKIEARGGTEMGPALEEAVELVHAKQRDRQAVVVLITDGQVAGEDSVLRTLKKAAGVEMPRIHTLGIDQAVNEGFLHRLADLGNGTCDLVESETRLDEAMDHFHRGIGAPVLTGLRLQLQGCELLEDDLAPSRLPELFSGRPVTILGRYRGDAARLGLRVDATDAAGQPWSRTLTACPRPAASLLNLWGRAKVRELEDRYAAGNMTEPKALAEQIVQVSLECRVLSRFTAYVAVDRSEVVNQGGKLQKILQPVEAPAGWEEPEIRYLCSMAAPAASLSLGCRTRSWASGTGGAQSLRLPKALVSELSDVLGQFGRSLSTPRTITGVAQRIRGLLEKTKLDRLKTKGLVKHLAAIVALLQELASLLQQTKHPVLVEIEKSVTVGSDYSTALQAGSPTAPDVPMLQEYFNRVVAILDAIENPSPQIPERKEFWA